MDISVVFITGLSKVLTSINFNYQKTSMNQGIIVFATILHIGKYNIGRFKLLCNILERGGNRSSIPLLTSPMPSAHTTSFVFKI